MLSVMGWKADSETLNGLAIIFIGAVVLVLLASLALRVFPKSED